MFIRSPRLFLRPVFREDWRDIYDGICDEAVVRMMARAPWPYREQDAVEFCMKPTEAGELRFAVTLPQPSGAPVIGMLGIRADEGGNELGYWIGRNFQGLGYCTEAVHAALQVAQMLGIERVVAGHFIDNPASGSVLKKAGFVETGELRPTFSRARNEHVLCRRYALELEQPGTKIEADSLRAA